MKLVTVDEMIKIEREADAKGHTYPKMMEHAGKGLAEIVHTEYQDLGKRQALGLVGSGNNGGDTLVAFDYLQKWGWETSAYIVRPRHKDDPLLIRYLEAGGRIIRIDDDKDYGDLSFALDSNAVILDGVLGTGIKLPLRGKVAEVLSFVGHRIRGIKQPHHIIAVDCPSGIDCDTGEAAPECLTAEITVTMAAIKRGLLAFPAFNFVGDLRLGGIGLPSGLESFQAINRLVADVDLVRKILPARPLDAHKGTFGTALIIAGSINYTGAVLLAGEAAYRVGSGLVTCGVPAPLHLALAGHIPEVTWLILPHELGVINENAADIVLKNIERITAILIGPGFGLEATTRSFISNLIGAENRRGPGSIGFVRKKKGESPTKIIELPPFVVDADGLKLLAKIPDWQVHLPESAVLTPHPGEMSVLTGLSTKEIQSNRIEIAEKFAEEWGHVVVLKGAHTIISAPEGRSVIIPVANPALARAGSGDVLAGLIVGLRAQGVEAFEAAVGGAWIHAEAGIIACKEIGSSAAVLAGDILTSVKSVIAAL